MAATDWLDFGTFSSNNGSGGAAAWGSPSNAGASDNSYASATVNVGVETEYLLCQDSGEEVPEGATIDGIEVRYERKDGSGFATLRSTEIKYVKNGSVGSTNKGNANDWPYSDAYETVGADDDPWDETLDADDANSATSGVAISCTNHHGSFSGTAQIDHVQIKYHYTEGGGGSASFGGMLMMGIGQWFVDLLDLLWPGFGRRRCSQTRPVALAGG